MVVFVTAFASVVVELMGGGSDVTGLAGFSTACVNLQVEMT